MKNVLFRALLSFIVFNASVSCGTDLEKLIDNHSSDGNTRWELSQFPLKVFVPTSQSEERFIALQNAAAKWSDALGYQVFDIQRGGENTQYENKMDSIRDPLKQVTSQSKWFSDDPTEPLAITTYYYVNNRIRTADVHYNEQHYTFSTSDTEIFYDYETIAIHELGHFLGLAHSEDTESVMYRFIGFGRIKRELAPSDVDAIRAKYSR